MTPLADEQDQIPRYAQLERALFCVPPVQWRHMQRSSWERIINAFAAYLHHFQAPVAFISGVEVFLCDNEHSEFLRRPWIGFVRSTPKKSGQTWVPDLQRLCNGKEYLPALQHCVGLFALTSINAEYLREHLPSDVRAHIPVTFLRYPGAPLLADETGPHPFACPASSRGGGIAFQRVVLVGHYDRDYGQFSSMLLPDGVKRAVLDGASARANIEKLGLDPDTVLAGVIEIGRLEVDAYDDLLSGQSGELHVLTLRTDGPACTLVVECVQRRTPLLAPRMRCITDYVGLDYPLLFDVSGHLLM